MKIAIIGALVLCLAGCNSYAPQREIVVVRDTTAVPVIANKVACDTVFVKQTEYDTVFIDRNDSLLRRLNSANMKLNRARYYLRICIKNPSQDKFLKGWIRRAVGE